MLLILYRHRHVVRGPCARLANQVDSAILRQFAGLRTDWLTDVADGIDRVGSGWIISVVGFALLVALIVLRALAAPVHVPRRHVRDRGSSATCSTAGSPGRARTT